MDVLEKIKSAEYRISDASGSSDIWKYFHKIVKSETGANVPHVICANCDKIFKFGKGASSSNLKKHVCYKRQAMEDNCLVPIKRALFDELNTNIDEELRERVLKYCLNYTIHDLRPSEMVNDNAFRELARCLVEVGVQIGTNEFAIDDILPHYTTLSQRLQNSYKMEREKVANEIRPYMEKGTCAATVDIGIDNRKQSNLIAFAVHYIDNNWQLQNRILFTTEFKNCNDEYLEYISERETAENINAAIELKFDELNLERKLLKNLIYTTNEDENIKEALCIRQRSRMSCMSNVLNTILKKTFDKKKIENYGLDVLDLISKCKTLIENLKQTGRIGLLETSTVSSKPKCCDSRWATELFEMFSLINKNYTTIADILEKSDESRLLSDIEKNLLDSLIAILEAFRNLILKLENETNPTIHLILLHMRILKEKIKEFRAKYKDDIELILAYCLNHIFDNAFYPQQTHKLSAYLWPEFKQLRYLGDYSREDIYKSVKSELMKIASISEPSSSSVLANSQTAAQTASATAIEANEIKYSIADDDDDMLSKYRDIPLLTTDNITESQITLQMEIYQKTLYAEKDILNWWRCHEDEFPLIAKLARKLLCIPATCVATQKWLSLAKRILDESRADFNVDDVDAIIYFHLLQKQESGY